MEFKIEGEILNKICALANQKNISPEMVVNNILTEYLSKLDIKYEPKKPPKAQAIKRPF